MKLQELLLLLLAPLFGPIYTPKLTAATDDVDQSIYSLRGSAMKGTEGVLSSSRLMDSERKLQFIFPRPTVPVPTPAPTVSAVEVPTEDEPNLTMSPLFLAWQISPTLVSEIPPTDTPTVPPVPFPPTDTPTVPPVPFIMPRPEQRPIVPTNLENSQSSPPRPTVDDSNDENSPSTLPRPTIDDLLPPSPTPPPNPPVAPTPPIRKQTVDVNGNACGMQTPGTLILHGGVFNYEDPLSDSLGQAIVREMKTNSENRLVDPLVFLPGARREVTDIDEQTFEDQWRNIMADGVPFSVLHPRDRDPAFTDVSDAEQADQEDFVRPLKDAMGVFLPGGRQWRLIDAYKYTETEEEMWNVLKRGGVIAGTSAGAAVMASLMPRGDPEGSAAFLAEREWHQHGFGFVSNLAVDNHVSARGREFAMYEAMNSQKENRKTLGIGLNENTMVVVKGQHFNVLGDRGDDSVVRVYDCSKVDYFDDCTFDNAPYTELRPGDWYDLCRRKQLFIPPSSNFNDMNEDGGLGSRFGAYELPYRYANDFKAGNPRQFLCSGRRCRFKSNPIVVDSSQGIVRITGRVFSEGSELSDGDRLQIRYRINGDRFQKLVFDTNFEPEGHNPKTVFAAIPVPYGRSILNLEIDAQTAAEGAAQFRVVDLGIE